MKYFILIVLIFFSLICIGQNEKYQYKFFYENYETYFIQYKTIEIIELNLIITIQLESSVIYKYLPYNNIKLNLHQDQYSSMNLISSLNYEIYMNKEILYKNYYIGQILPYTILDVMKLKKFIFLFLD
jgi:hypothetical protein